MVSKAHITAVAIAALSATSSFSYANSGTARNPIASAPFASIVLGEFTDTWNSRAGSPSAVDASVTNAAIAFSSLSFGALKELSATLNGVSRLGSSAPANNSFYTITTQALAGRTTLPAGSFDLRVAGTGITDGQTSYVGSVAPYQAPQSGTLSMLLASLGLMGTIAVRRIKANAG
jgi:hypothetical protein